MRRSLPLATIARSWESVLAARKARRRAAFLLLCSLEGSLGNSRPQAIRPAGRPWREREGHAAWAANRQFNCRGNSRKKQGHERMPLVFDMETGDPDDVLTLLFICAQPHVELRAVTLTPGSREQVSLVKWLLEEVGAKKVRVGAQDWPSNANTKCMNGRFYRNFGRARAGDNDCERADDVLAESCGPDVTVLTGGPLHNLGAALRRPSFALGRWVAQGGFAGEGVVPRELQMDKFAGQQTCQTWNFNGNIRAAEAALSSPRVGRRVLVSKNVCHRVVYDSQLHEAIRLEAAEAASSQETRRAAALGLIHRAMSDYGPGKKLHDPLALAVALDESVCTLQEVKVFHTKSGWGSVLEAGTSTWISVDYCRQAFHGALLGTTSGPSPLVPDNAEAAVSTAALQDAAPRRWRKGRRTGPAHSGEAEAVDADAQTSAAAASK